MRTLKTTFFCWISGLFLLSIVNSSQSAPIALKDTIWVKVTYFDFHANGSNPEFEQRHYSDTVKNMVAKTLDADNLPVLGSRINLNRYIEYWFRDWKSIPDGVQAKAKKAIPTYNTVRTSKGLDSTYFVSIRDTTYDTAFKNIVIEDFLPFTRVANSSLYEFVDSTFFPLDGKGFGSENRRDDKGVTHNYSFTMSLHYNFTKTKNSIQQKFYFTGDDDVWAFINKQLVLDLGGVHMPVSGNFTVDSTLTTNKEYSFDFFFAERHTTQSNIRIQTNLFEHEIIVIDLIAEPSTTIRAGDTARVHATVESKDLLSEELKKYAESVIWKPLELGGNADACVWGNKDKKNKIGDTLFISPTEAYTDMIMEAAVFDSILQMFQYDTVTFHVIPGPPTHLVIEENPIVHDSIIIKNLREDTPLNLILIGASENIGHAYAVARDAFGNYVRLADSLKTNWSQVDPSIISTAGEVNHKYHGIITRIADNDSTFAIANEPGLRSDSTHVVLTRECIDSLRLKDAFNKIVTKIEMTSGEKRSYTVEGFKSGSKTWVSVDAKWELVPVIKSTTATPDRNTSWTFDPTEPGQANLILSRPYDTSCTSKPVVTIPVTVSIEKVSSVHLSIITPESDRIAGDTLLAVVEIKNSDGLIPGNYCLGTGGNETQQVIYQDTLKNRNSEKTPVPRISVDGNWTNLNMGFTDEFKNNQCFTDGVDTIKFVSYFAPSDNTEHLLTVDIGEKRKDQEPFVLIPAQLDSIDITDNNHNSIITVQEFKSGDLGKSYISVGYDKYDNKLGDVNTDWKTDGEIRDSSISNSQTINYGPGKVEFTQNGILISQVVLANGKTIRDQIDIRALGLPAQLDTAYTHDDNGNGYLDRLSLIFDKKVTIAENVTSLFQISYGTFGAFNISKIVPIGTDGKRYSVYLKETLTAAPQTDWKPLISSSGQNDFSLVNNFSARDSAAPVVWKAVKTIVDCEDRTKDILIITMSESVRKRDNNKFKESNQPDLTFNVWIKNDQDSTKYDLQPLFKDIPEFHATSENSFTIRMTNRSDISADNYINVKYQDSTLVDINIIYPGENNFKRQVIVLTNRCEPVVIPNPTSASFIHTGPAVLDLSHDKFARKYAKDGLGAAINIKLPHALLGETVKAHIKIYDIAGNLVNTSYNGDFLRASGSTKSGAGSYHDIDIYWNGSNSKGMKVAPGVYRTVLYFVYSQHSTENLRYILNIGIKK